MRNPILPVVLAAAAILQASALEARVVVRPPTRAEIHGSPMAVTYLLAHRQDLGLTDEQVVKLNKMIPTVRVVEERMVLVGLDRVPGKANVPRYERVRVAVAPAEAKAKKERLVIKDLDRVPGKAHVPRYERVPLEPAANDSQEKAEQLVITGLDRVPGKAGVPRYARVKVAAGEGCPLAGVLDAGQMVTAHQLLAQFEM